MKLSLSWLDEYVHVPDDLQAFCDRLDLTGTGVEGVETLGEAFDNVVTAQVITKEKHPDSDHMWVCTVDVGENNVDDAGNPLPLQIVCGAQNFNAGDHIVVAMVGAVLPGDMKIKKSKLRGVVSAGMNCSERELGLGNSHDGIMILPADAPVGMPLAEYLALTDTVLDLEITPNRPDCLSVVGLAREVGAMYQADVINPLPADAKRLDTCIAGEEVADAVRVTIEDDERCSRYSARVIDGVTIAPSPGWLANKITAMGARPINNVVDVTNYILYLYGQPLHAFDYDALKGDDGKVDIIVRAARDGEKFTTLDGQDRVLDSDMTVIATPKQAVALAGVMGGLTSEVEDTTTTVLLEAATFSPAHTSRTSRKLGLISESSLRYERKVDSASVDEISRAAAALIAEVSGGRVRPGVVDVYPVHPEVIELTFRIQRFNDMMGADIPDDFIIDILKRLGCAVTCANEGVLAVTPPTFRPDLEREIDLYEEVLRLWGMDRIESSMPRSDKRVGIKTRSEQIKDIVNDTLRASGLSETMTYSFVNPDDVKRARFDQDALGLPVTLMNPMNSEQSVMRQTIIPNLLVSVERNQSHGVSHIQLYEIGNVFTASEGKKLPREKRKVAGVLAGSMDANGWNAHYEPFDFFDAKGVIENLARELAFKKVRFKALDAESAPELQPGRAAEVLSNGISIGWVGELHPSAVADFGIKGAVAAFELDMDAIEQAAHPARDYVDVPVYPAIEIDQAFVVDDDVTHERMMQVMTSAGGRLLESVSLFDVYRDDERLGVGKRSMAYKLIYRAPDRTLTTEEVERAHGKLVTKVSGATGAEVRA